MKKTLLLILCLSLTLILMPFNYVDADAYDYGATYLSLQNNVCYFWYINNSASASNDLLHKAYINTSTSEVRAVILYKSGSNQRTTLYLISNNPFTAYINSYVGDEETADQSCSTSYSNSTEYTYNDVTYYVKASTVNRSGVTTLNGSNFPYIDLSDSSLTKNNDTAYRYAFGDLSFSGIDLNKYGNLRNVGFYTDFVNYQMSNARENLDHIRWNGFYDDKNNDLISIDNMVDIRARRINYISDTVNSLFGQTQSDIVYDDSYTDIISVNASKGSYDISWGEVVDKFHDSKPIYEILYTDNKYMLNGWVYQIRLRNDDNLYTGEWQTIYTMTSLSPSNQQTMSEQDEFSQKAVDMVYQIDTLNQTIPNYNTYNYTFNNTQIVNPDGYQDTINGKPWYAYLLEGIQSLINTIVEGILGIGSDIVKGLFDFVTTLGVNVIDFFSDVFDNLKTNFESIDLDLPMFNVNFDKEEYGISRFIEIPQYIIDKFFDAGIGYMILIPLILMLVGVIF